MAQQTYALILNGVVQQTLTTDQDVTTLFASGLQWVVAGSATVDPGYTYDGQNFTAPAALTSAISDVSLSSLQAELATLQTAIAALEAKQ